MNEIPFGYVLGYICAITSSILFLCAILIAITDSGVIGDEDEEDVVV